MLSRVKYMTTERENEFGKAGILFLVVCAALAGSIAYRDQLGLRDERLYSVELAILGVIAVFALGCQLHMVIMGAKSPRKLAREVKLQMKELTDLTGATRERISEAEKKILSHHSASSPRCVDALSMVRRINIALERKIGDINHLLRTGGRLALLDAHTLLNHKLIMNDNAIDALMSSEPLPALETWEIGTTIDQLFEHITFEEREAA